MLNSTSLKSLIRTMGLAFLFTTTMSVAAFAAEVTLEDLSEGPVAGQGSWQDYDGEPSLVEVKTVTPAHLGEPTQVLVSQTANDFVTLQAQEPLGLRVDGGADGFEADLSPGRSAIVEVSVGHDLDVKPAKGGGDPRRGPTLGFSAGKFMIRSANPNAMSVAEMAATDDRTDWYRLRLVIDWTANGGQGAGDLLVRNLTDGEAQYRTVIADMDLQFKTRMGAVHRDPSQWNAWLVRTHGAGGMIDNLRVIESASADGVADEKDE